MTENFAYSHIGRPGMVRPGYVGNTVPGVEQKISEDGEILVKSPGAMKGYFKMPEENERFLTRTALCAQAISEKSTRWDV